MRDDHSYECDDTCHVELISLPRRCGPCHAIAPKFEAFSKQYQQVVFCKCDVDACSEVAKIYSVSAMPSFVFIKNSNKIDLVRGADPRQVI